MTTLTSLALPTISTDLLAGVSGGDKKSILQAAGRVAETVGHDAAIGAAGGGAIGAAAGIIGGPAAPATIAGGAATGTALGGLGGALFGLGRGLGNEYLRSRHKPAKAK